MSSSKRIVWIDDNPVRASTANDLGAKFINVRGADVASKVKELLDGNPPYLVLIDHVLDKAASTIHPVFQKGSTIAEAIKEKWPACPVVGITAGDNLPAINLRTKQAYDSFFPFHHFGSYLERIKGIGRGFALVAKADSDPNQLVHFLKPPRDEDERLHAALTDDLKQPSQDESVASRFYCWVEHILDRPGFLYDCLWTATFLGLNESGFDKIAHLFEKAMYAGVFVRPDEHRWWVSRLSELLYKQCQPQPGELSRNVGRRLPGIKNQDFSICYFCKEDFPETVGFLDEDIDERRALHLKCTVLHPRYKRELYFEDIRMMREK